MLFCIFLGFSSFLLFFYTYYILSRLFAFLRIQKNPDHHEFSSFSIIIPARNEAKNIEACLSAVFSQEFPAENYEVILVNDNSEDATRNLAENFLSKHNNFRILDLENVNQAHKKNAIKLGISKAKFPVILTTDADCVVPKSWLTEMNRAFAQEKTAFVTAPVKITPSTTALEHFQAIEYASLMILTAGNIALNHAHQANGANLAYRKSVFEHVKGFDGIDKVASGDDELLMHKIKKLKDKKIAFVKSQNAIVETAPVKTFSHFMSQRLRWLSKSSEYRDFRLRVNMVFIFLFILLLLVSLLISVFGGRYLLIFAGMFGAKYILDFLLVYFSTAFLGNRYLRKHFLYLEFLHLPYSVFLGLKSLFGKKVTWKSREL